MKRYIHIFLYATTLLAMVGCVKSDLESSTDNAERVISFTSTVEATRGVESDITSLQNYGKFNIAAFLSDDDNSHYYTDVVNYSSSLWASDATRYWPVAYNLNMFAYSPMEEFIVIKDSEDYDDYSLLYTCPVDIKEQVDLLVQTLPDLSYSAVNRGVVDIEFLHALSSIKFNVLFGDESNISLNTISMNYVNIEKQRTYNFSDAKWEELDPVYFDTADGLITVLDVYKEKTLNDAKDGYIMFDDIDDMLIIVPQSISSEEKDPHYISIQVSYSLIGAQDASHTFVTTGVMPLPSPNSDNEYKQGELYTYNIEINGETIAFGDITIEDQEEPVSAYGNIDLSLITARTEPTTIEGYTAADGATAQYYYTTALRVESLLLDGVRDFVVVGSMGASGDNHLGDGKLGYYGASTSPFSIGADLAASKSGESYLFSVDLRGTYDYPEFQYANSDDTSGATATTSISSDIEDDDPILVAGLFSEVKYLNEVILPHGIMAIGNHAFEDCEALEYIDIADIKHIEIGAFQHSSALKVVDNGALTRIHDNGFDECVALTTIDLSKVTQVDQYGFVNCSSLGNVDLSSLNVIGIHAFDGCESLTLMSGTSIPGFESVADYAFSGCKKLGENGTKIDLTEAEIVGDHAFNECVEIRLSKNDSESYINLALLKEVGSYAFNDCQHIGSEYEVAMPIIESIETFAFEGCSELNIIDGLQNLTTISSGVFKGCTNLTGYSENAAAADKLLSLPLVTAVESYGFHTTGVTDVVFDKQYLTSIGDYAFDECKSLVSISGVDNVSTVGRYAFSSCVLLEELVLPALYDGGWGRNFFTSCTSLKKISLPNLTVNTISWVSDTDGSTNYNSIISMIGGDFVDIEEIYLSSLVGDISGWHFQDKPNLRVVDFASVESVGNGAFYGCKKLVAVNVESTKYVGSQAFKYCELLNSINLPEVETIDSEAFSGCSALTYISAPIVVSVGDNAFNNCVLLGDINLPKVENIGSNAFSGCSILTSISAPIAVSVGDYAFNNCVLLSDINLPKAETIGSGVFNGCSILTSISAPIAVSAGDYAFQDCVNLQELELSSATTLGDDAISGCTSLVKLVLPSLEGDFGGYRKFDGNTSLKYIDLSSVDNLASMTFQNNAVVVSIDLRGAATIGDYTFQYCTSLQKLNLSSLEEYETTQYAFSGIADEQCEIWLSDAQAATVGDDNKWQGIVWKAVYSVSDNVDFSLE